ARRVLVAWLERHLTDLAARSDGMTASLQLRPLGHICDAAGREHAEEAFGPLIAKIGGSERRLGEALEASAACVDLRRRQADAAAAELARQGRERRGK